MEGKLRAERILILTLSFGAGHVRAAETLGAEFALRKPEAEIRIIDALEDCRFLFRVFYVWTYWLMIRFAPSLWGKFFASRVERKDKQTAPIWAWRWGCRHTIKTIEAFRPNLIVCCEVGASELAVITDRRIISNVEIVNVITDFEAEPIWVTSEAGIYVVAHTGVRRQLEEWGAPSDTIHVCGIPIDHSFTVKHDDTETRRRFGWDGRPIVLMMGGGMGPTRMDAVASLLLESGQEFQIVALPGLDKKMARKLGDLKRRIKGNTSLHVVRWTDEVASLMQSADLLITKAGGLTLSEAAACGVPLVLFDSIPGPETSNALHFTTAGAAVKTSNSAETALVSLEILANEGRRKAMASSSAKLAQPNATKDIVDLAISRLPPLDVRAFEASPAEEPVPTNDPMLILTISNGFGHIRLANALASAIHEENQSKTVIIVDVADYMTRLARFTHVTAYLWLVKNLPPLWALIDRFQKKQSSTSPEWFYRQGCKPLFDLASKIRPGALVATEVGCCEIATLIKRDLNLDVPLVAVNGEMDADRAWVQPEVDLYSCVTDICGEYFIEHGAKREKVTVSGPTVSLDFGLRSRHSERIGVCHKLALDPEKPVVLLAGGSEGIGLIEETARKLLDMVSTPSQLLLLTGRNESLRSRCEGLAKNSSEKDRLRVLTWTDPDEMPGLMSTADLMVSKLGTMFYEAIASELPIVAMEPPPGAERLQYKLLDEWGVGRAVSNIDEMALTVAYLLSNPQKLEEMRINARTRKPFGAAQQVAKWLVQRSAGELWNGGRSLVQ